MPIIEFVTPGIFADPLWWSLPAHKKREVAMGLVLRWLPADGINVCTLREVIAGIEETTNAKGFRFAFHEWSGERRFTDFLYWLKSKRMLRVQGPSYYLTADVPDSYLAKVLLLPSERTASVLATMTPDGKERLAYFTPSLLEQLALASV